MDLREVPSEPFRRHPWETARARFFLGVLAEAGAFEARRDFLDVGAGDGWFSSRAIDRAAPGSTITLWDSGYGDLFGGGRADPRVTRTAARPEGRFDVVLLMDVLEHVEDDLEFLSGVIGDNAAPGATVLVSVPAWQILYSRHDRAISHYRRYAPRQLRRVVEGAGLEIVRRGGLFHSLLLPRTVAVARERLSGANGESVAEAEAPGGLGGAPPTMSAGESAPPIPALRWRGGALSHRLVQTALELDNGVSRLAARLGVQLPGLTVWALCRA